MPKPAFHGEPHVHEVQVYYEDTDFTGVVYHANYLRYFERGREHLLGVDILVDLYHDTGVGFVVYKADLTYREGAKHGDTLEIRTRAVMESRYRAVFEQQVWRKGKRGAPTTGPLVDGEVHLVCVDENTQLVPLPEIVVDGCRERFGPSTIGFKG